MNLFLHIIKRPLVFAVLLLIFTAAFEGREAVTADSSLSGRTLTLYTAFSATTPQIPLWDAIAKGWPQNGTIKTHYWKSLDDLRGVMLSGKGDIWIGHVDGFAQAAKRGAPVTLLAVTGWKKFYLLTTEHNTKANSLTSVADILTRRSLPLAIAPQDSPAIGILEEIALRGGPQYEMAPMQPQQLMLELVRGTIKYAILPEPLVSALLKKSPEVRIICSLEEEAAYVLGRAPNLPLAGIAVKTDLARRHPEALSELLVLMQQSAELLANSPDEAVAALPENIQEAIGKDVIKDSLQRDIISVIPAAEAKDEVVDFLRMVLPEFRSATGPESLPADFFFMPEGNK